MAEFPDRERAADGVETLVTGAPPEEERDRRAVWLQFPRRILFLLIAYGLALALIRVLRGGGAGPGPGVDWGRSLTTGAPVADLVAERLPNTLLLLATALTVALLLALTATVVALLVHALETKTGPLGSAVKGLGRVWVFGLASLPAFGLGAFAIYLFVVRWRLLPLGGVAGPAGPGDRLQHLVLPVLALALLPATLTAQAVAREVTLPLARNGCRLWLAGLFRGLGALTGQIGGLLSALVLVEVVFAWPGLGRLMLTAALGRDYPVLLGGLAALAGLVLAGRLAAELFRWLERWAGQDGLYLRDEIPPWRRTARKIWAALALALLLIPLVVGLLGLGVDAEAVLRSDLSAVGAPPSPEHPWGADELGRDLRARVLRGGLSTLVVAAVVAGITLLPAALIGAVTGVLASRRRLWAETVADLVLLPADVLLFLPIVPAAIALVALRGRPGLESLIFVGVALLLPRAARAFQTLWTAAPEPRRWLRLGLGGLGGLFLGTLFAAFGLVAGLDFLGLGLQPPAPTLGGLLANALQFLGRGPQMLLRAGVVLWLCAFALYTAADGVIGFFDTKAALVRLNE